MTMRKKGKVHPFNLSSSSPSPQKNVFPILNLLPAAILTLISVLCFEEREVLAYMISRSLKSTNPSFFDKNRASKTHSFVHKFPGSFDCDCFECYISFWFRWDSSPNRELIHQAIETFEEHLNNRESGRSVEVAVVKSEMVAAAAPAPVAVGHRGLARKVLPDVLGIFNSRLCRLWSPNM